MFENEQSGSGGKSARTFDRLLKAATRLFVEKKFEKTTMRDISRESELALGAVYYYARSKEELVIHFYEHINGQVADAFSKESPSSTDLDSLFTAFLRLKLRHLKPYRELLRVVLKEVVDPDSPLSPLSRKSARARETSMRVFNDLVTRAGVPAKEKPQTARGLWLMHMGIIAYWLHDRSPDQKATNEVVGMAGELLKLSKMASFIPGMGSWRTKALQNAAQLFSEDYA